ncbi:D-glycerate dehydrogenase [Candidatus Kaiserbacteria bacterium]|nr:D-glycerate dehydrogenase [Candidatus Kaiserbacteria bacterium]
MASVYVTRKIPEFGLKLLQAAGHDVTISEKDGVLTKEELLTTLSAQSYDAVLCLLTDTIDGEVFDAVPSAKIFANYAVGYNNIDLAAAAERGVIITNTPGVLTDTVAEYALSLILATVKRIPEADRFTRAGKYEGWAPELFLGSDMKGKTLGILGAGRIGSGVAERAHAAFGTTIIYYDVKPNPDFEKATGATYKEDVASVLKEADIVSVHVPLLESTHHLIGEAELALMKPTSYLINTSRGPVVDEDALVVALEKGVIRGAGLDVFENEPTLASGLAKLENVVITAHIASASEETRSKMSEMAAQNIIDVLAGNDPQNPVTSAPTAG